MSVTELTREAVKIVDDSPDTVLAEMIADYEQRTGKTLQPAHIERLLINTFAYRETLLRGQINESFRQQHPRFATGLMLDLCGDDVNTPRLNASAARCTIRFQAAEFHSEVNIPVGTLVGAGDVLFATIEQGQLTAGQLQTALAGAAQISASNISVPTGGAETESDEAYRERVLLAPESFSVAGSVGAYQYWARAVSPAICDVHVANAVDTSGNPIGGTVAVTVLTKTGAPTAELISQVQRELSGETKRPLCDTVLVYAPKVVDYTVDADLVLFTGANAAETKAAAEAAWAAFEAERRQKLGSDIVPLAISGCLKVAGVYNVILKSPSHTIIAPNQWARCIAINLRVLPEQQDG